jgi:cytochrome d ubiquinol oxidase subunit I
MDTVLLSRIQFAFTVGYHFLFVPFSLGIGLIFLIASRRAYKSGLAEDDANARFWLKLFAATFAIGVATGITMEFAFGTNWAAYSRFVGNLFGAPLAAEGLFAFFLESTVLGILLFGRNRVSRRFLYVSTWLVVLGAHLSALWILIANSWQQTPRGYAIVDGKAIMTSFWQAAIKYSTLWRFLLTVASTWLAGAFIAAAIAAWYLRKGRHIRFAKQTLTVSLILGLVMAALLPILGDRQAQVVAQHQPVKMAAFEGIFKTGGEQEMMLLGWVNPSTQTTTGIGVPDLLSIVLTGSREGVVPGLDTVPQTDWPPLQATFQSYHLMVLIGIYLGVVMLIGVFLLWRKKLEQSRRFLWLLIPSAFVPYIAIQAGWAAAEIGRQPWIVQGLLRTKDGVSAVVPAGQVAFTLAGFVVIYVLLFIDWAGMIRRIIRRGPEIEGETEPETVTAPSVKPTPSTVSPSVATEGRDV